MRDCGVNGRQAEISALQRDVPAPSTRSAPSPKRWSVGAFFRHIGPIAPTRWNFAAPLRADRGRARCDVLRVLVWNMGNGFGSTAAKHARAWEYLRGSNERFDVALLQETRDPVCGLETEVRQGRLAPATLGVGGSRKFTGA